MLNNKADFILEYIHAFPSQSINKQDVDWSQSRIIFIAPEFTRYQQYAIGFKDLGIQLWEVHKYNNGLLIFNEAKSPFTKEPLTAIAKRNPAAKRVTEQIKVYTEEDHFKGVNDNIKEIYQTLKAMILGLGNDIQIKSNKVKAKRKPMRIRTDTIFSSQSKQDGRFLRKPQRILAKRWTLYAEL